MSHAREHLAQANRYIAELMVQIVRQRVNVSTRLTRASAQRWRSRYLMRSNEAFAYSRTRYLCSVAADHPAPSRRVTPRPTGSPHTNQRPIRKKPRQSKAGASTKI